MSNFKGFTDSETFTQLPDSFFRQLLNEITDADELKVTLYFMWRIEHMDGPFRAMCITDFDAKELGLAADEIASGLEKATKRGSLLKRRPERSVEGSQHEADVFYFLNSPLGRAAAEAFAKDGWRESAKIMSAPLERPNVFKLYEENIGPLTPLIADALKDAEETYSAEWIADAIGLAVKNNKRNWKYCEAILKRWKEEGRAEKQDRRDDQASRQRDVEDKIKKFVGK
ncbi:MAG: DnaD domain protein [Chloroflexi bacterium]|nr:DnaD domain protein [Chloroflexota bacterium]